MSKENYPVPRLAGDLHLVESGTRILTDTARWGIRLMSIPMAVLPFPVRRSILDSSRLGLQVMSLLPQASLMSLNGFIEELDDIESRAARREDLGRRLRREMRAQADFGGR